MSLDKVRGQTMLPVERHDVTTPMAQVRQLWRIITAETLKQHRTLFSSRLIYFSLFIWPALQLASAYYTFQPFSGSSTVAHQWSLATNPRTIFLFFTTGMLGYTFFWSLVQSAWHFSFERFNGTLELLFLSPANRFMLVLANGAAALIQSVWLFFVFTIGIILLVGGLHVANAAMFLVAFLGLLIPAIAWATFLNSLFIFSRDSGFLYTILDDPMSFLAGVKIPLLAFPFWVRLIGLIFPLTTSLIILRGALLEGADIIALSGQLLFLLVFSALLLLLSVFLLKRGEEHARKSGSLTLF